MINWIKASFASLYWAWVLIPMSMCIGTLSALFIVCLEGVTRLRFAEPLLLWFLPVAGALMVWFYERYGKGAERGNQLLWDEIHQPMGQVPIRMVPLVFVGTLLTHLCGGSAGREGTALQMGGGVAAWFARVFVRDRRLSSALLVCGLAAGFGAVFGTALAGSVFAVEVLGVGRLRYRVWIYAYAASWMADWVCEHGWGVKHKVYQVFVKGLSFHQEVCLVLKVGLCAVAFALAARGFSAGLPWFQRWFARLVPVSWCRPFIGGLCVIALCWCVGHRDYLGLGEIAERVDSVTISSFFMRLIDPEYTFLWKAIFTIVTLGVGFKGGEVTPLFFIGAALGNALAGVLGAPLDLFAALGMISVFAGATHAPLASMILGMELFGFDHAWLYVISVVVVYLLSGNRGIYSAQRVYGPKWVYRLE